jgi:hypothetical protein
MTALTPQTMIADLDAALSRNSEPIRLRRKSDATAAILELPGNVVNDGDPQLAGNLAQQVMRVIVSPTQLRQWTVATQPAVADAQLPAKNLGDEVYLRGRWRAVEQVTAYYPQGVLVRVNMRVVG